MVPAIKQLLDKARQYRVRADLWCYAECDPTELVAQARALQHAQIRAARTLRHSLTICHAMQTHDARDYRVMMAREVYSERKWRKHSLPSLPADCARIDLRARTLADRVESENGETFI